MDHGHGSWLLGPARPGGHALVDPRGPLATDRFTNLVSLLNQCSEKWGQQVIHVWDRGFAGGPWLRELTGRRLRFIMRWHTGYFLVDDKGSRHAWQIARGKRSVDHRMVWDIHRRQYRKTGIVYLPVRHPQVDQSLWLVVSPRARAASPGTCSPTNP